MSTPEQSPLGKTTAWPDRYDASLLFPIERSTARNELGIGDALPFIGHDLWTAYELAWLDARGKPCVGIATFRVPATSPNLIESKSLKLYLNSFAHTRIDSLDGLHERIAHDLSDAAGAHVGVAVLPAVDAMPIIELDGECIDELALDIADYGPPNPDDLRVHEDGAEEALVTHLFRSNCPVTGQPDWASVQLHYRGPRIDREGLLRYLVSFRSHNGFHEQCVEQIFRDVIACCHPDALSVHARYTRRGGLDINPWRATLGFAEPPYVRTARQ
ncbi:MAG: NADPH-dependent 7-cyano-7-deazaguanine reductase QueF [Lysobacteraceae bacterium]